MDISWPTVGISFAVSACTGGLAGAVFTRFASVGLQKSILRAQARSAAIKSVSDWIATTYNLYWTNESTYTPETKPPTAKSSLNDSAYRSNRSLAELAVKTYFGPAQFAVFKEFGDWVEGGFMRAFSEGEPLSFTEFHAKSEELLGSLQRETW